MAEACAILPLRVEGASLELDGNSVLRDIDLRIDGGPPSVLLGPNGAGKSMLLRLLHGLVAPTSGRVAWQGPEASRAGRHQAMVLQQPVLLRRSAAENIAYALRAQRIPRREREERIREALAATGLEDVASASARRLSVGQQQRLCLARAWALAPEVLFLDEPTSSLDPAAAARIEQTMLEISERGTKVVLSSHDLPLAKRLAGEVFFLHHGEVLEHGAAEQFFQGPRTAEAQAFLEGRLGW